MVNKLEENFKNLIKSGNLFHAYLFFGGGNLSEAKREKFNFAVSLANFMENKDFAIPLKNLNELLIIGIDEKKSVGIESVRKIKNFLYQKPVFSNYRTVIIKDSENLTVEAQNAILKIAEEPPKNSLIIFISPSEEIILPALSSRLQKIHFPFKRDLEFEKVDKKADIDYIVENDKIDEFFESLIFGLMKNPIKNFREIKEVNKTVSLIKQFNLNKRLQLRALMRIINHE